MVSAHCKALEVQVQKQLCRIHTPVGGQAVLCKWLQAVECTREEDHGVEASAEDLAAGLANTLSNICRMPNGDICLQRCHIHLLVIVRLRSSRCECGAKIGRCARQVVEYIEWPLFWRVEGLWWGLTS